MDGAERVMLCPGMCEGGGAPAPLGALTEPESSGAASTSLSELSTALINSLCISLIHPNPSHRAELLNY